MISDPVQIDALVLDELRAARERIRDLEARLEESEDTLDAIRSGAIDAVVVLGPEDGGQVYTLESADRPYRALIEQIQEGALTLGSDGTVLYCNPRLAEMLGLRQERVMGQLLDVFVSDEDHGSLAWMLHAASADSARGELSFRGEDGTPLPMYLSLSPLDRNDGAPLLCGVLTDLRQQKLHLRELGEANDRLRAESLERERVEEALRQAQKMEAVGQLTGGIAHDFNNLLTIIKSSTDLLRRPDLAEARRKRYVDAISDTVDRAAKLTGQLLAFARRQPLKPEIFDLCDRVRSTIDMLGSLVGSRIRVERRIPSEPCHVEADVSQFETALVNMAVNARDAMDGEGILTIEIVATADVADMTLRKTNSAPQIALSVTDTGSGIPEDKRSRIFEPFFTTKEVGKGTGLGLSQVFGFAKQSGGDVTVDSVVGRGTTFTLTLPQVEPDTTDEVSRPEQRGRPQKDSGGGRRVLVVEDNADVGAFSTQLLQDLG